MFMPSSRSGLCFLSLILPLLAAVDGSGCAAIQRQQREQRVDARTDEILWTELVPKHEIQRSCREVSDATVQFLVGEGFDIASQSATQVITAKRYHNEGGSLAAASDQQTTVATAAFTVSGQGCRVQINVTDRFGWRVRSERAPNWELLIIEKVEPEKAQAMHTQAKDRAEVEDR